MFTPQFYKSTKNLSSMGTHEFQQRFTISDKRKQASKSLCDLNVKDTTMNNEVLATKYMTVKQWVSAFGFIPEGGIRHLIFSNKEFEEKVVKRLGRKILLDVQALENFIAEQSNSQQTCTKHSKNAT